MSVDALVLGLWGEQPPSTAAKTLQSHVKRLRDALEPGRARGAAGQVLITRAPGYLLRVGPGTLDATRFEELAAKAGRALADDGALVALTEPDTADPTGQRRPAFLTRWDVTSGRRLTGPIRISSQSGDTLLTSPDGARLIVVNGIETLVLAARTFRVLRRFPHKQAQPQSFAAALRPTDGRTLALWPDNGPIEFLDLVNGQRRTGGRPEGGAWSIRFSPDGMTLATGGDDTVKLWDVASGQLLETFQGHEARVGGLRFSVDGRTLYSSGSKSIIAWDLEGSSRLGRPYPSFTGPTSPGFIANLDASMPLRSAQTAPCSPPPWPWHLTRWQCSTSTRHHGPAGYSPQDSARSRRWRSAPTATSWP